MARKLRTWQDWQRVFMRLQWRVSVGMTNYLWVLILWGALVIFTALLTLHLLSPTLAP